LKWGKGLYGLDDEKKNDKNWEKKRLIKIEFDSKRKR
jgi:hypothetical protein